MEKIYNTISSVFLFLQNYHSKNFLKNNRFTRLHVFLILSIPLGLILGDIFPLYQTVWIPILLGLFLVWYALAVAAPYFSSTQEYAADHYKTLTIGLYLIYGVIVLSILVRYGMSNMTLLWIMMISWGFFFFDARWFAYLALSYLCYVMLFTLYGNTQEAEIAAEFLYFYLVLVVIVGLIENYLFDNRDKITQN